MPKKNREKGGIVYSTHPENLPFESLSGLFDESGHKDVKQDLIVRISSQGRAGKKATLIQRFKGTQDEMEKLSKELKVHCGVGGSVKNEEIVLQGDLIDKAVAFLQAKGFKARRG
ncbi:MAG: translation initiation factor [Flavobacteriales bacterium]|nr:translation initiation factor [Flavobacteriales bacterium]